MAKVTLELESNVQSVVSDFNQAADSADKLNKETKEFGDISKASFKQGAAAADEMTKSVKKTTEEEKESVGIIQQIEKELTDLKKKQKEAFDTKEIAAFNKKIDDGEKKLKQLNNAGKEGFDDMGNAIEDTGGKFDGLLDIAGGFGLALGIEAIIGSIFEMGAALVETIGEFTNLRGTAQQLTGATGDELDSIVTKAQAISKTFDEDVNEVLIAANTLSKEFNITQEEALGKLEAGFLSGANATGELIDSTKEFSSQIAASGGDVDDLISILDQSTEQGIFSDKGIDVVKEFGLRIREQAQGTSDALEAAFGEKFTKDLFKGINDGSISSIDALKMVSEQLNDTSIPASELQTVIADVFGGPGEDAGLRYLQSLKDIDGSAEDLIDTTNALTRQQLESLDAEERLAEAQNELSKLFETDSGSSFFTELKAIGTEFLVNTLEPIVDGIKFIADGFDNSALVSKKSAELIEENFTKPKLAQLDSLNEKDKAVLKQELINDQLRLKSKLELLKAQGELGNDESLVLLEKAKANKKILDEINKVEEESLDKRNDVREVKDKEAADKAKKAAEKAAKEREQIQKDLDKTLDKLRQDALKAEIDALEGEEKINAIKEQALAEIDVLEQTIIEKGKLLDKDFELTQEQADQLALLRKGINQKAAEDTAKFRAKQREDELKEAEKTLDLREQIAIEEIEQLEDASLNARELEELKQEAILNTQREFAQERLKLLEGQTGKEAELERLRIQGTVKEIDKALADLDAKKGKFSFAKLLGVTDEEFAAIKDSVQQIGQQVVGFVQDSIAEQIAANQALQDSINERIDETEDSLKTELELNKQGFASNVEGKREELEELKKQREQAQKEQEKLQKRQLILDTALQLSGLITSSVNIFKALSPIPFIGVPLAIAQIALMFGAFTAAKVQAFQAISAGAKLEKGGTGTDTGMITGNRHYNGGERFLDHVEVEEGERWSVFNRGASKKHAGLIANFTHGINAGMNPDMLLADLLSGTGVRMSRKIDKRIKARDNVIHKEEIKIAASASSSKMIDHLSNMDVNLLDLLNTTKDKPEVYETAKYVIVKTGNNITKYKK